MILIRQQSVAVKNQATIAPTVTSREKCRLGTLEDAAGIDAICRCASVRLGS